MNLRKAFVGNTLDGEEHILEKKVCYYGKGIYFTDYIDLESKEVYNDYQIDLNSLKLFTESLNVEGRLLERMTKRRVKKIYKADRKKMIDVRNVFYGELIVRWKLTEKSRYIMEKITDKDVLLLKNDENEYIDAKCSKMYPLKETLISGTGVDKLRPIDFEQIDFDDSTNFMLPKRKLLEMDYRKKL